MYPENTLLAFNETIKLNTALIEFDVRICDYGIVVIIYDASVNSTTDGNELMSEIRVR